MQEKVFDGSTASIFLKTVHILINFAIHGNAVLVVLCNLNMYSVNPGGQKAQG